MKRFVLLLCALIAIFGFSIAFGDMAITEKITLRAMGVAVEEYTSIKSIKGDRRRVEYVSSKDKFMLFATEEQKEESIELRCLDLGLNLVLFPGDSSFTREPFQDSMDTISPFVSSYPDLESAFNPKREPINWQLESKTQTMDTLCGFPCLKFKSTAIAIMPGTTGNTTILCEFWTVPDTEYIKDVVVFHRKFASIINLDEDYRFNAYRALLSKFDASFSDLGLDSLEGFPLKVEISLICPNPAGTEHEIDEELLADEMVSTEILESEAAAMAEDTALIFPETDSVMMDSMIQLRRDLLRLVESNMGTGHLEFIGLTSEIISIDTTTVLPDSLFEIPPGYTER